MSEITVDDRDFRRAARALDRPQFKALADETVGPVLLEGAKVVRQSVRTALKPHRRTGKTAGRVRYKSTGSGVNTAVTVKAGGPIAHLVAYGAAPHEIGLGKSGAQALTLRGRSSANSSLAGTGNKAVRAAGSSIVAVRTVVHHPGYRPASNFWDEGVRAAQPLVQDIVDKGAVEMTDKLAARIGHR